MMLLERAAERIRISAGLTSARGGRFELIVIRGPVGIGRSMLLRWAAGADHGVRVLRAAGAAAEQDVRYGVWHQLFDTPSTAAAQTEGEDPYTLLGRLHGDRPVMLVVDDLQYVDEESLAWLARLARMDGFRVLLLCAVRDGDARSDHPLVREILQVAAAVLRPEPLSPAAGRQLLQTTIGRAADDVFAAALHDSTGGSPLLLATIAAHVHAIGMGPDAANAAEVRTLVPPDLRDRLTQVLAVQTPTVRAVARAMAALGERAEFHLVEKLAGTDDLDVTGSLRGLRELGLVTAADRPRFTHAAVRAAVESEVPMTVRRRVHEDAAELLYRNGHPAEEVARQLVAVPTFRRPWLVDVLRAAADAAQNRGAPDVAVGYLRRALLSSSSMGPDRAALLLELATVQRDRDPEAAENLVDQAVPLLDDPRDRAAAALRIAPSVLIADRPSVVHLYHRAAKDLDTLAAPDAVTRAVALSLEARLRHAGLQDPDELDSALSRLRELGAVSTLDSAAERQLVAVLLQAAVVTGRLPATVVAGLGERILEHETLDAVHIQATVPLTVMALTAADALDPADRWLSLGVDPVGLRLPAAAEARLDAMRALVLLGRGRLTAARSCADRAAHLAPPDSETDMMALGALAWIAVETQDELLADRVAGRMRTDSPLPQSIARYLRAYAASRRGRLSEALEELSSVGVQMRATGWRNPLLMPWRVHAAALADRLGDRQTAAALLDEEHAVALSWGAPSALGRVLRAKGEVEGGPRGLELLRDAVTVLRRSGNDLELARALLALGRVSPDNAEAVAANREGTAMASACGASWLVGAKLSGRPALVDAEMTKAERLVASFVARGLTNREIAVMLNVSSRAVEKHLTRCYRKLNLAGRAELIAALSGGETDPQSPL